MSGLKKNDTIMVISPSSSAVRLGDSMSKAKEKLESLGYKIKYSDHIFECDEFFSSSIESRIHDLHQAFLDKEVKAILSSVGGFNCNELLPYIDFDLIKNNPKILCGFSDITILLNAIYKKTGLISYLGVHYSSFAMKKGFEYSLEYFNKALSQTSQYEITPSKEWSNEGWFKDQENRTFFKTNGWKVYNEGKVTGTLIGGNLNTLNLLQGTPYMPDLKDTILLIEETGDIYKEYTAFELSRNLTSLIQQVGFEGVKGILIGRNELCSQISEETLIKILDSKKELRNIPILYDVDFGHTTPNLTLPIGGIATMDTSKPSITIER